MNQIPQQVSESVRRRNPHLYGCIPPVTDVAVPGKMIQPRRIRQSTKPLMNKLEQEWFDSLCVSGQWWQSPRKLIAQSITFRLANGLRYTPDVFCLEWPSVGELDRATAWEVKGKWFTDDANAKLKMFAAAYPEIRVILVWKDNSQWQTQRVLP